jgi:hypothetical protein
MVSSTVQPGAVASPTFVEAGSGDRQDPIIEAIASSNRPRGVRRNFIM